MQQAAWENTHRLPLLDVPTAEALTGAMHVCAYECFFSRWSDPERGAQSSCLLVPPTLKESDGHSFCYGARGVAFVLLPLLLLLFLSGSGAWPAREGWLENVWPGRAAPLRIPPRRHCCARPITNPSLAHTRAFAGFPTPGFNRR